MSLEITLFLVFISCFGGSHYIMQAIRKDSVAQLSLVCFPEEDAECGEFKAWTDAVPSGFGGCVAWCAFRPNEGFLADWCLTQRAKVWWRGVEERRASHALHFQRPESTFGCI